MDISKNKKKQIILYLSVKVVIKCIKINFFNALQSIKLLMLWLTTVLCFLKRIIERVEMCHIIYAGFSAARNDLFSFDG